MGVDIESSTSPQVKLVLDMRQAFVEGDLDRYAKPLHKDFCHVTRPRSLGKPQMSKDEHLAHVRGFLTTGSLTTGSLQIQQSCHAIVEVPGKLVVHATTHMTGLPGLNETELEAIWILDFAPDEDGSIKIKQIEEFSDTKKCIDMSEAMKASK